MPPHETRCPGCNKPFKSDTGYSNHKRQCKLVQSESAARLNQRRENLNRRNEAAEEVARIREENMGAEEAQMEVGDIEMLQPEPEVRMQLFLSDSYLIFIQIEPLILATRVSGLPNRVTRLPARYQDAAPPPQRRRRIYHLNDELPSAPPPLIALPQPDEGIDITPSPSHPSSQSPIHCAEPNPKPNISFRTLPDRFGVYHIYPGGMPLYTPDESYTLSEVVNSPNIVTEPSAASDRWYAPYGSSMEDAISAASYAPFLNISVFLLMSWFYSLSNTKSHAELDQLVNNVILHPEFSKDDFVGFSATKETKRMDDHHGCINISDSSSLSFGDQWTETSVFLSLPCDKFKHASEQDAPKFEVKGLYHRSIVRVIKSALLEPAAEKFHLFPFECYWKPGRDEPDERIYSEAYTADHFLQQYEEICLRPQAGDKVRTPVVAALMFWSDSTHLASLASLWPIYLYFGNQSKYTCAKPSSFAAHHLAYVPKVHISYFIVLDSMY